MAQLKVTLVRSASDAKKMHQTTVQALGLKKIGHSVIRPDNKAVRGMVRKVSHLVTCEEVEGGDDETE